MMVGTEHIGDNVCGTILTVGNEFSLVMKYSIIGLADGKSHPVHFLNALAVSRDGMCDESDD